jgi:hypothetical protein
MHQVKYTKDLTKKFNMTDLKHVSIPMSTATSLAPDEDGEAVDQREYRSMIGSLLYLTVTRSDIQFTVFLSARFQASPHRIWYSTSSSLDFVGFSDADFAGLILRVVGLIERVLLVLVIFSDLLLFVDLLTNTLLLHSTPPRLSM